MADSWSSVQELPKIGLIVCNWIASIKTSSKFTTLFWTTPLAASKHLFPPQIYALWWRLCWWIGKWRSKTFYRGLFEKYGNAVYELARRILAILSEGMEQNSEFFYKKTAADGFLRTSINYYPPCPQPDLVMGTSCHEDASSITILQQDGVCGLEVPKVGNWVSVSPIPHAFVVKIGDILQASSSRFFHSPYHLLRAQLSRLPPLTQSNVHTGFNSF